MSKYLYMVNPKIQLKLCGEVIRRPKNLELDKEEVKFALKHGPVYRKFDAQTMERVTLQNLDEMHVEKKGIVPEVKMEEVVTPIQDLHTEDEVVKVSEGETPQVDTIKDEPKPTAMEQLAEEMFGEMRDATPEEQQSVSDHIESISEEVPVEIEEEVKEVEATSEEVTETTDEVEDNKEVEATNVVPAAEGEQKEPKNNNYYRKKKRNR